MAIRREKNQPPLARLRAAHVARVRRTVAKVERGKVAIGDVAPDIREEVDTKVKEKAKVKGGGP